MEVCDRVMNGEFVYPEDAPVIRIGYSNSAEFTSREFDIIRELAQLSFGRPKVKVQNSHLTIKPLKNLIQIQFPWMILNKEEENNWDPYGVLVYVLEVSV